MKSAMILDSTCSQKRIWPEKADVRMDINAQVNPDVVADAKHLPFREESFDEVFCDPPHRIRGDGTGFQLNKTSKGLDYRHFGAWLNKGQYFTFLYHVNREFARVLKTGGLLHFKTSEGSRSHGNMIERKHLGLLTNFQSIEDISKESKGYFSRANQLRGKSASIVVYALFRKSGSVAEF